MIFLDSNKKLRTTAKRIDLDRLKKIPKREYLKVASDGVQLITEFLNDETLTSLNSELDELFRETAINKNITASARLSRNLKEITQPIAIESINVLELAVDIKNIIKNQGLGKNLILTNVEVFSEVNNDKFLPFHTDQRKGMYRAQIYLKGGKENSGGFAYIAGTHDIEHSVKHHLSKEEVIICEPYIFDMGGNPGDLIIFDSFGFHGKDICTDERRTIMFEYQERDSDYVKSSLKIDNRKITSKIIDNLSLFMPGDNASYNGHGMDYMGNNFINAGLVLDVVKQYCSFNKVRITKVLKALAKKLR